MNRMKKMILLLGVLVLVLCGYMLMNRQQQTAAVQEETGTFALTAKTAEEMTALEWTKEEETFSFVRTDGVWKKADHDAYPVAQAAVDALADQLTGLEASRKLENVTDASLYGLSEPAFTVTARWSDGTSTTYQMGDQTPFGDGWYLSLAEDSQTAYTTSAALSALFDKTMNDFADMQSVPSVAEVTRITVGSALDASYRDESATINASQHWYTADGRALDGVEELVTAAETLEWEGLAEAAATEAQLAEWKLDEANAVTLTLCDGDESVSILFGAADENGSVYARLPESAMVYTVAADSADALLNASDESLRSLALAETDYDGLQEAVFTAGSLTHAVTPPAEAAEGEEAAEDPMKELWEQFTALEATEHIADAQGGETLLTVSVSAKNGHSAAFTFMEYDAEHYIVTDGERAMLTDAGDVDKLIRTVKNMK